MQTESGRVRVATWVEGEHKGPRGVVLVRAETRLPARLVPEAPCSRDPKRWDVG